MYRSECQQSIAEYVAVHVLGWSTTKTLTNKRSYWHGENERYARNRRSSFCTNTFPYRLNYTIAHCREKPDDAQSKDSVWWEAWSTFTSHSLFQVLEIIIIIILVNFFLTSNFNKMILWKRIPWCFIKCEGVITYTQQFEVRLELDEYYADIQWPFNYDTYIK